MAPPLCIIVQQTITYKRRPLFLVGAQGLHKSSPQSGIVASLYEAGTLLAHLMTHGTDLPRVAIVVTENAIEFDDKPDLMSRYASPNHHYCIPFGDSGGAILELPLHNFLYAHEQMFLWEECEDRGWLEGDPREDVETSAKWFLYTAALYGARVIVTTPRASRLLPGLESKNPRETRLLLNEFFRQQ